MTRSFLSNYHLKLLAAGLMVIDHVGVIFFPEWPILRVIGRFSFPLFAWLLVRGENHTHHLPRYALRLMALGFISQPIYTWAFEVEDWELNILFTLTLGLLCLRGRRRFPGWEIPIWLGGGILAQLAGMDYGMYGIWAIALIRIYQPKPIWWLLWLLLHLFTEIQWGYNQLPALVAPFLFHLATGEQGRKARWFYWFYPVHLLMLWLIHLRVQHG